MPRRRFTLLLVMLVLVITDLVVANDNATDEHDQSQSDVLFPKEVTIDAAFRYDDDVFLISGREYMALSPGGVERYIRRRSGKTGVPVEEHIKAAIRWPEKPTVFYYGRDHSFKTNMTTGTTTVKEYRKYREFLHDGGPDAVVFKANWFYVFRGCQYVTQQATLYRLGDVHDISEIDEKLPCDLDAVWSDVLNKGMVILLKGDQIWKWKDDVQGPFNFEDEYLIWSWQLKPTPDNRFEL